MPRTTATEVKQILSTSLADAIVDAFIAGANVLVTEVLGSDTTQTDAHLEEIERWLAAHMIASTREQQLAEAGGGPAPSVKFQGEWGKALEGTSYGQMVLILDTTGKFKALQRRPVNMIAISSFD